MMAKKPNMATRSYMNRLLILCFIASIYFATLSYCQPVEDTAATSKAAVNETAPIEEKVEPDVKSTTKQPSIQEAPLADSPEKPISNAENATTDVKNQTVIKEYTPNVPKDDSSGPKSENGNSSSAVKTVQDKPIPGNQDSHPTTKTPTPAAEVPVTKVNENNNEEVKVETNNQEVKIETNNQELKNETNNQQVINETQTKTNDPLPDEKVKTYDYICDNCTCPSNSLENPYIVNCTRALPGHVIPPWNTIFEIEGDPDVDNVHLILEFNGFTDIPVIKRCPAIDSISFSYNEIKRIEANAFVSLPNLKRLILSHNQLAEIHGAAFSSELTDYCPIEVLDLSFNNLSHLDNNVFDAMKNLEELKLEGNPFGVLDSSTITALNSLPSLNYLDMANTGLADFPITLINPVRGLYRLDISHNRLTAVPEVLQHGNNLNELILSGNLMENFNAASFIELENLRILDISDMPNLKIIYKGTFFPLQSLTILRCNNNPQLATIELRAFHEESNKNVQILEKVELRNNKLTMLSKDMFHLMEIDILDIRQNPYMCSCEMEWIQIDSRTYLHLNETTCAGPDSVQGMLIKDINFETAEVPCPEGWRDHASFVDIKYIITESYGFWVFILLVGMVILAAIAIIVFRSKPEWQYKIMRMVSPQNTPYRNNEKYDTSANIRYMRQFDDDQGFSEDVITEYSLENRQV